ncbi:hypothetical protein [Roseibium aggregatum]|uniref:Glycoside hydrolase n=1 Tax=Roseibium aggregatum TaxID=187304 RepID=A0A939EK15_9HYPH|nr:hypothetical protein [Roseibium aggregatum]MBN9673837.1 hypothetical protein [Roseibium aggregatum]
MKAALLIIAVALAALGFPPASADDGFLSGVNRVNLAWRTRAEQQDILNQIAKSGVTDVRLSLARPVDRAIRALKIANRLGLSILLEVQLANKSYYPPDRQPRTAHGRTWDVHRLSDLDLDLYRSQLRQSLQEIDAAGIRLHAVEPGNEINIAPYNGDLLIHPARRVRTARGISELTNPAAFERGLDKYIEALRITREELGRTALSREAKLISAGLSDMGPGTADRLGFEHLNAAETIELLQQRGIDDIVDAYGIHIYPNRRTGPALARRIDRVLEFCRPDEAGTPCWITEWGIANVSRTCPVNDSKREPLIRQVRENFGDLSEAGRLEAVYYYDWDSHERYSIWRCGRLSPAGALAVGLEAQ